MTACSESTVEKVDTTTKQSTEAKKTAETKTSTEAKQEKPKEEAKKQPDVFKVGDAVKFNNLVITVNSVKDHNGNDFQKPDQGHVYKVLDITVENTGDKDEVVSSIANTSMADSDGYTYNIEIATFIKNQLDGSVPAGRKLRGQLVYEVPKNVAGLEFIFKDPFRNGQANWKIK